MKLPCIIVHDLLPLYAEHLTSPETDALLAEHLQSCPACAEELHTLQLPMPVQADVQADAPLKSCRKKASVQQRQRFWRCCVRWHWCSGWAQPALRPRQNRRSSGLTTEKKMVPTSAFWKFRERASGWT